QQQGVKGNNADNGKDGKKEKVVLTEKEEREWVLKWVWVQEGVWVEDVAGKMEKCAGNKAVEELRENKNVKFMSLETRAAAAKAGNAVIARERTKTNEKLVEAVVDVEKRLTNTGADETRQVVEDVMKQRSNTERYFDSESDARTVMNAAMISKNPFSLFSSPYEKNDNPNVCSLCSAKNSIWEALHFGEKRIRENIKVQLLGKDWEMRVREAAEAKPWINGGNWDRKREETLALSEGTNEWVSLKVRAEREPLGKRLKAVMMGLKELVIGAMSEVLEAGEKK
ncbi:MAG: hypothetical protein LE178_02985, partial [Endomicrobium sp.]|nr:hypothetical protein [Endomicrobium sp.]